MAMVASDFGNWNDVPILKRFFPVALFGPNRLRYSRYCCRVYTIAKSLFERSTLLLARRSTDCGARVGSQRIGGF
jgi:hypothetical protein